MKIYVKPLTDNGRRAINKGYGDSQNPRWRERKLQAWAKCSFYLDGEDLVITIDHDGVLDAWRYGFKRRVKRGLTRNVHNQIMKINGAEKTDYKVEVTE